MKVRDEAETNIVALARNPYPGRGIIVGLDQEGENLIQVYWIMGRSENSRNRIFGHDGDRVFTEMADISKVKDSSLIIYNAMREAWSRGVSMVHIVSNGSQTDDIWFAYENGHGRLFETMQRFEYEPDPPNFTPRIAAVSCWVAGVPFASMIILRKSLWSNRCDRNMYEINGLGKGFGYCITTYSGDGDPLPSFRGEPYLLPLIGDTRFIADTYWEALNHENKVSLAVKFIPKRGHSDLVTFNKYQKKIGKK
ncbi:MAG: IMP cyclohydrolase [bacterium]